MPDNEKLLESISALLKKPEQENKDTCEKVIEGIEYKVEYSKRNPTDVDRAYYSVDLPELQNVLNPVVNDNDFWTYHTLSKEHAAKQVFKLEKMRTQPTRWLSFQKFDLGTLIQHIKKVNDTTFTAVESQVSQKRIAWEYLWAVFQPDTLVKTKHGKYSYVGKIVRTSYYGGYYFNIHVEIRVPYKNSTFPVTKKIKIDNYSDVKPFSKLPSIIDLESPSSMDEIEELKKRGQMARAMMAAGMFPMHFNGSASYGGSENEHGETEHLVSYACNNMVIVDPAMACEQEFSYRHAFKFNFETQQVITDDQSFGRSKCPQPSTQKEQEKETDQKDEKDQNESEEGKEKKKEQERVDKKLNDELEEKEKQTRELRDMLTIYPFLLGCDLSRNLRWCEFYVEHLSPPLFNESAIDELILPEVRVENFQSSGLSAFSSSASSSASSFSASSSHSPSPNFQLDTKKILHAFFKQNPLISKKRAREQNKNETQNETQNHAQNKNESSNEKNKKRPKWEDLADIISTKGRGRCALLAGEPGKGKTLTAQAYSQALSCPLICMSAATLGLDASAIETQLEKILMLGYRWNAFVLLDEADVYISKRDVQNLQRNAVVSAFLRKLEEHEGVVILTTNLIEIVDPAILSRMHLVLEYKDFTKDMQKQIWSNLFKKITQEQFIKDDELEFLSQLNLNGRDIRNSVIMGIAWAREKDDTLPTFRHIMEAILTDTRKHEFVQNAFAHMEHEQRVKTAQGKKIERNVFWGEII